MRGYIREQFLTSAVSAPGQYVQVPGPVVYKRKYTLWILILLVIVCWPVAIIYYFTRDKVPVQELQTYQAPMGATAQGWPSGAQPGAPMAAAPAPGTKFCPSCGAAGQRPGSFCSACGKPVPP